MTVAEALLELLNYPPDQHVLISGQHIQRVAPDRDGLMVAHIIGSILDLLETSDADADSEFAVRNNKMILG